MSEFIDTQAAALLVQALACNARVEAMKAENAHRQACGDSPAYGEDAFNNEALTLEHLAAALRERS